MNWVSDLDVPLLSKKKDVVKYPIYPADNGDFWISDDNTLIVKYASSHSLRKLTMTN